MIDNRRRSEGVHGRSLISGEGCDIDERRVVVDSIGGHVGNGFVLDEGSAVVAGFSGCRGDDGSGDCTVMKFQSVRDVLAMMVVGGAVGDCIGDSTESSVYGGGSSGDGRGEVDRHLHDLT